MSRFVVGVDVGGTYTDILALDLETGIARVAKTPSTRPDQSVGFLKGVEEAAGNFAEIGAIIHGTTVGTNALLERKGAKTGVITTEGFRDVLEMRRRDRPATWGLRGAYTPIAPAEDRLEATERTLSDGTVHTEVDLDAVEAAARQLIDQDCAAVCVFFINGYANPANEMAAVARVRQIWPNAHVTAATEILPEIREFERLSTAALNAYLQPPVAYYLKGLETGLAARGFTGKILIVQSNGGVMGVETAKRLPVRTALSGPAAGVIAASEIAKAAGVQNIVTCDMGGTSFDVSLIADGAPALAAQTSIDFGMVVRSPMIEITTIGAGGGSIAWLDKSGLLEIGPESAGSDPGPVAYGKGATRPTVTDANIVLGRINPDRPIGKLDRLDVEAAREAIRTEIAEGLDLSIEDAAEAILKVANAKMAGAIRLVSIEKGRDPAKFTAMPFGGGGALHTGALIREVGLAGALAPRYPGVTSALGCVVADMRHDRVQTVNRLLDELDAEALGRDMAEAAEALEARLAEAGAPFEGVAREYGFDMLYLGQTHTVTASIQRPKGPLTAEAIRAAFEGAYRAAYGRLLDGIPVRVMNWRVAVTGRRPRLDMAIFAPPKSAKIEGATRPVYVNGAWVEARILPRLALPEGFEVAGPAVLEQPDATIFIDPGLTGEVDQFGNLLIAEAT